MEEEELVKIMRANVEKIYFKQPKLKEAKLKLYLERMRLENAFYRDQIESDRNLLNEYEKNRWDRQIRNPILNQNAIRRANVAVFGCGGIGSNVLLGLVYSGVHNLKIVDFDEVELSNLNRTPLYTPKNLGALKCEISRERLLEINPAASIESFNLTLDYPKDSNLLRLKENEYPEPIKKIDEIVKWADNIVIGVDYLGAPYLLNDLCIKNQKPFYWSVVNRVYGEIYSYFPRNQTPCFRCIFGENSIYRYKKATKSALRTALDIFFTGINLGSTVIITGNIVSERILYDINGFNNDIHGHFVIYNADDFDLLKIPMSLDNKCACQQVIQ